MLINPYRFAKKTLEFLFGLRQLNDSAVKGISVVDPDTGSDVDVNFDGSGELDYISSPLNITSPISTATYSGDSLNLGITVKGVFFSADGSKLYVSTTTNDEITQYTLNTPWQVSSADLSSC